MTTREILLERPRALNQKEAAFIMRAASKFSANVMIHVNSRTINAKSVMGMLSLGAAMDGTLRLTADGKDEAGAIDAVEAALKTVLDMG